MRAVLVGCGAAILAGCAATTPAPVDETALPPVPERFSGGGEQALPDRWWEHFQDPRLDRVVGAGLDGNFSLQAARERLRAARAAARAAGAALQPSLEASTSARVTEDDGGTRDEAYGLGLSAAYELDLWGRLGATADAARLDAEATRAELGTAAITLSAETASTFYQLLHRAGTRALLQEQLETNRQVTELMELRYRNGAASADEVLRQEQLLEQTQSGLVDVAGELELLSHRLAVLTGRPPAKDLLPEDTAAVALPPLPDTGVPAVWLRRRPDLQQAFLQLQAADARLAAAVAEQYPRVSISASVESSASSSSDLFDNWLASLAANLAAPVFDGGRRAAEVDRTEAARAAALRDYGQTVLTAVQEVEDALTAERRDRALLANLETRVERATRIAGLLQDRYLNGTVNYIDVLDALSSQQQLQRELLGARWALAQDRIALARALAGGWEGSSSLAYQTQATPNVRR